MLKLSRLLTARRGRFLPMVILLALPAIVPMPQQVPSFEAIQQNNIGIAFLNQYLYAEAAAAFQKALEQYPGFDIARVNLGIALYYKQDYEGATRALDEAGSRQPQNPRVHYMLGLIQRNQGEQEKAAERFTRVTVLDPADAAAFYNLGVILGRLRRGEEAEAALRRCLELEPLNTSAMYNLGTMLLRSGRGEEGNRILERFRALQRASDLSSGMSIGNQYGEMGRYAIAADYQPPRTASSPAPRPSNAMAPFRDVGSESGLPSAQGGVAPDSVAVGPEWDPAAILPFFGGGIALADLDGDGDVDAVVTHPGSGGNWKSEILLNDGRGRFEENPAAGLRNSGREISAAAGDYDNDGLPDIYLSGMGGSRLFHNEGKGGFRDVTVAAGVADGGFAFSATFLDLDHDGDLDIHVSHHSDVRQRPRAASVSAPVSALFRAEPDRVFLNNGNGTFAEAAASMGLGGEGRHNLGAIGADFDNDRDVDLLVVREDGSPLVLSNERSSGFKDVSARSVVAGIDSVRAATVADFDRDGAMDVFTTGSGPSNHLLRNKGDGTFQLDVRTPDLLKPPVPSAPRATSGALDFDNDGDLDLYVFGWGRSGGGSLWENVGDGRFVFAGRFQTPGVRGAASADFDGDGRVDILLLDERGAVHLLRNEQGGSRNWIGIRLEGRSSNRQGFGAKVEVRAGALYQKFEVSGHNGYLSQDSPTLWIGLGDAKQADSVTVRWPSGILQSEIRVAGGEVAVIRELDRKGTSCPLLYTWNGKEFEFVTDFLGGSAIGYLTGPGSYNTPDTDEYVKIEGARLVPKQGELLLNLNNQLEEVILFDQAALLAVDHPKDIEIYPDERLLPAPPFPPFRIWTVDRAKIPVSAVDEGGNDVLSLIAEKDRRYPDQFRQLPFKGYAEEHSLIIDLGDLPGASRILLLMDAWIDYADSTANLAASQAGISLIPPYLQVKDADGRWQTVVPSMGFPAGLPKTMTLDLSGKFLSPDHHVRIVTNMRIYWDRIRVETSPQGSFRLTRLDPLRADLHFRGYPQYYSPDGRLPWIYDYSRISLTETWGTHAGAYTRFGDVLELLTERDDKFVITRHGDEISLAFDAALLPGLPAGWTRDYLLYADGFGKDMDLNSLYPEVLGPLPFHAMTRFPYPAGEQYPDDEDHREYRRTYNTRVFPVRRPQSQGTGN